MCETARFTHIVERFRVEPGMTKSQIRNDEKSNLEWRKVKSGMTGCSENQSNLEAKPAGVKECGTLGAGFLLGRISKKHRCCDAFS